MKVVLTDYAYDTLQPFSDVYQAAGVEFIPLRLTGDVLGYFSRYSGLLAGSKWRRFSIVSTAFRRRNAKTIPRADYTTVR